MASSQHEGPESLHVHTLRHVHIRRPPAHSLIVGNLARKNSNQMIDSKEQNWSSHRLAKAQLRRRLDLDVEEAQPKQLGGKSKTHSQRIVKRRRLHAKHSPIGAGKEGHKAPQHIRQKTRSRSRPAERKKKGQKKSEVNE